jgi:hypothetical protein
MSIALMNNVNTNHTNPKVPRKGPIFAFLQNVFRDCEFDLVDGIIDMILSYFVWPVNSEIQFLPSTSCPISRIVEASYIQVPSKRWGDSCSLLSYRVYPLMRISSLSLSHVEFLMDADFFLHESRGRRSKMMLQRQLEQQPCFHTVLSMWPNGGSLEIRMIKVFG